MQALREIGEKLGIAGELIAFLWYRKMWWLIPVVAIMLLFGVLVVAGSSTGVGPLIYTLF